MMSAKVILGVRVGAGGSRDGYGPQHRRGGQPGAGVKDVMQQVAAAAPAPRGSAGGGQATGTDPPVPASVPQLAGSCRTDGQIEVVDYFF